MIIKMKELFLYCLVFLKSTLITVIVKMSRSLVSNFYSHKLSYYETNDHAKYLS